MKNIVVFFVDILIVLDSLKLDLRQPVRYALEERATIFTHDDDFLSMVAESAVEHCGIIYVHQQHLSIGECIRRLKAIVETMSSEDMHNRILFL